MIYIHVSETVIFMNVLHAASCIAPEGELLRHVAGLQLQSFTNTSSCGNYKPVMLIFSKSILAAAFSMSCD